MKLDLSITDITGETLTELGFLKFETNQSNGIFDVWSKQISGVQNGFIFIWILGDQPKSIQVEIAGHVVYTQISPALFNINTELQLEDVDKIYRFYSIGGESIFKDNA